MAIAANCPARHGEDVFVAILVIVASFEYVLFRTGVGRRLRAVGSNPVGATRVGRTALVANLRQDKTFVDIFTDVEPLLDYVGNNSMHLRRMATISRRSIHARPSPPDAA